MKLQVCFLQESLPETVRLATLCEDLDYDVVWLPDQSFHRDPFVTLAMIGHQTSRIKVGLGVTNPYSRHPAQIARAIATVDEVSCGRAVLGLGAGNKKMFLDKLGIPQDRPTAKVRASVLAIRRLLAGECVTSESPDLTLREVELEFPARAEIPIYVASRAPRMLALAAEVADGVIAEALFTPGGIRYVRERIAVGAEAAGRSCDSVDAVFWQIVDVTEDRAASLEMMRPFAAHIIGASSAEIVERMGIPAENSQAIREVYRTDGQCAAAAHVRDRDVDAVAIIGDVKRCTDRVHELAEEGVDTLALLVRGTPEDKERSLRLFAEKVVGGCAG
jgi:5,10-methylenetetrahydromethanopterin reductase